MPGDDQPGAPALVHVSRPPLPLEHRPGVRNRADQFRLLVGSEQPCLAQLPVYREHDLRADAGHRLQVDRAGVLAHVYAPRRGVLRSFHITQTTGACAQTRGNRTLRASAGRRCSTASRSDRTPTTLFRSRQWTTVEPLSIRRTGIAEHSGRAVAQRLTCCTSTAPSRSRTRARPVAPAPRVTHGRCATHSAAQPMAESARGRCSSGCGGPATACGTGLPGAALRTSRRSPATRSSPLARHVPVDAIALGHHHAHHLATTSFACLRLRRRVPPARAIGIAAFFARRRRP